MRKTDKPLQVATGVEDPELIATAKARLTPVLGPITQLLVEKEAKQAKSPGELYRHLAQPIDSEKDKELFLKAAGASASPAPYAPGTDTHRPRQSVPAAEVDLLTAILTHYLGPMAAVVARRESKSAASAAELKEKLALRISHGRERADFLKRAEAR